MKIAKLLAEKSTEQVEKVLPTSTLKEAASKLIDLRIGALVVCDAGGKLVGIVSERDLLPAVANMEAVPASTTVFEVMSTDVITCGPQDEVAAVLHLMNTNSIRHIPVMDDQVLINMVSIRELTKAYELLQKEADTDHLTELSNRRPFLRRLEAEFARAKRLKHHFTVAMVDIDHFKAVNDTYGHDAGDEVLRAVSAILVKQFRTIDMVGRLGGEEFAIIFPETKVKSAEVACERLLRELESTSIFVKGHQIGVTASVGLAGLSTEMTEGVEVLRQADEMLYDAKRGGRNRVVSEHRQLEIAAH